MTPEDLMRKLDRLYAEARAAKRFDAAWRAAIAQVRLLERFGAEAGVPGEPEAPAPAFDAPEVDAPEPETPEASANDATPATLTDGPRDFVPKVTPVITAVDRCGPVLARKTRALAADMLEQVVEKWAQRLLDPRRRARPC